MGLVSSLFAPIQKVGSTAFSIVGPAYRGNIPARIGLGAGIGGAAGFLTSDRTGTRRFEDMFRGATLGAIAGPALPFAAKTAWKHTPIWRTAKFGAKTLGRAGRFAFEHPLLFGGGVAGMYAASNALSTSSPTTSGDIVNINYNQQLIAAQEMGSGIAPMGATMPAFRSQEYNARKQMAQSTSGLVQGLHRGRH